MGYQTIGSIWETWRTANPPEDAFAASSQLEQRRAFYAGVRALLETLIEIQPDPYPGLDEYFGGLVTELQAFETAKREGRA